MIAQRHPVTAEAACRWPAAALALAALAAPVDAAHAQASNAEAAIKRLVLDASRALQSANAALFMGLFDRSAFEGYAALRQDVFALTAQCRIASSVAVGAIEEDGSGQWAASVDWLLELSPKLDPGPIDRRHRAVRIAVRKRGKRWRIVDLAPAGFFAPVPRQQ